VVPGQAWQEDSAALLQCPSLPDSTHMLLHINPAKVKLQQHGEMRDRSLTFIHSSSSANTQQQLQQFILRPCLLLLSMIYTTAERNPIIYLSMRSQ
jgi:hypothetical protein